MKIIHSFWSKPSFHNQQNFENARKFGGWLSYKYFLLSTCFSCLTLKRYHQEVDLYTDTKGFNIFINQLALPYDHVSLVLDDLEHEDHRLWVLGKLKVIKLQDEPFIHVDNDVFVWKPLFGSHSENRLIAQSEHLLPSTYKRNLEGVFEHLDYIPPCLQEKPTTDTMITNIGIIGGSDIDFFQEYCDTAYGFLEKNLKDIEKINVGGFNQIMDEYLFTCLAKAKKQEIQYFIDNVDRRNPRKDPYEHVLRFHLTPLIDKYIHVVGIAKQNQYACEQLELRLQYEFPDHYEKIVDVLKDNYPDLIKDNLSNMAKQREKKLLAAINKLYTDDLTKIENTKIQLAQNIKIVEMQGASGGESKYVKQVQDPVTGKETHYELIGSDNMLAYFASPISIKELLEEARQEHGMDAQEHNKLKFKLLDVVLEKIIVNRTLEFV